MKLKHAKKNSGFTLVELLVVIAIIAGLAAISSPIIIQQIAKSRATQAVNNGRDIHIGLRDQSITTGSALSARAGNANLSLSETFARGFILDEKPFYVKGVPGAIPGDGDVSGKAFNSSTGAITQGNVLEVNTNVFSYFDNGTTGANLVTDIPNAPLLATPVVAAGVFNAMTYNVASFGSQAVIVRVDGSVTTTPIDEATQLIIDGAEVIILDRAGTDIGGTWTSELPNFTVPLT